MPKSGGDVKASNVEEFLKRAVAKEGKNGAKIIKKECLKWHPDALNHMLRGAQLLDVDQMMIDMICQVLTDMLNSSGGRNLSF
jgi:hypothetical protein